MAPIVKLASQKKRVPVHEAVDATNRHSLLLSRQRHYTAAIVEVKRAIAVEPRSKEMWSNLGTYYWGAHQYEDALAALDRSLSLDPTFAVGHHNKAIVLDKMRRCDEAEKHFGWALEIDPEYLNAKWCRSMMRLSLGDYARGWEEYETRLKCRINKDDGKPTYPRWPAPYWQGEPIHGRKIFCCVEQGIGDSIMFARWLPWLREQLGPDGTLYLCCSPQQTALFWDFYISGVVDEFVPECVQIPETDFSVVLGSLPWHSRCTLDTLPPDPGHVLKQAKTQLRIGPAEVPLPPAEQGFRVGIAWTGNPDQDENHIRSIPLDLMMGLAAHPRVWLYSLQVDNDEISKKGAGDLICDLGPQLGKRGLIVTASAVLQMDLIITCCTSIAHLAGALGVETWIPLAYNPYWVWMYEGEMSPWYPSVRLFRQDESESWKSVMNNVFDALCERVDNRASQAAGAST